MFSAVLLDLYGVIYPDAQNQSAAFVAKIKELGLQIIVVTNLNADLARQICDQLSIQHVYLCQQLGLAKTDPELYEQIIHDHELTASEVVMLDDTCANLQAAGESGVKTVYFGADDCPFAGRVINSLDDFLLILSEKP